MHKLKTDIQAQLELIPPTIYCDAVDCSAVAIVEGRLGKSGATIRLCRKHYHSMDDQRLLQVKNGITNLKVLPGAADDGDSNYHNADCLK